MTTMPNYEKALDKALEREENLKVELKKKDELLFAYESVKAPVNPLLAENERLREVLRKIADQANRATMVQDRSVDIIKGVCGVIFSEAKQALKGK